MIRKIASYNFEILDERQLTDWMDLKKEDKKFLRFPVMWDMITSNCGFLAITSEFSLMFFSDAQEKFSDTKMKSFAKSRNACFPNNKDFISLMAIPSVYSRNIFSLAQAKIIVPELMNQFNTLDREICNSVLKIDSTILTRIDGTLNLNSSRNKIYLDYFCISRDSYKRDKNLSFLEMRQIIKMHLKAENNCTMGFCEIDKFCIKHYGNTTFQIFNESRS